MKKRNLIIFTILFFASFSIFAKEYKVLSPDNKIELSVTDDGSIKWGIRFDGETLLNPSPIQMALKGYKIPFGFNPQIRKVTRKTVDNTVEAVVPSKNRFVRDYYNEMTLHCKGGYAITFRVYNNGAAYRFETDLKEKQVFVESEQVKFNFPADYHTYWPREENPDFITHCEGHFDHIKVSQIQDKKYAYLPIYLSSPKGTKMVIMDADLFDYPNLFLFGDEGNSLRGEFPKAILESKLKEGSDRNEDIIRNADYIAATSGKRTFPWRLMTVDADDRALLENNLVWQLSSPSFSKDTDWIKPGKISWEWWNSLNVYGVDFEAGVNTDTYKCFIDFAAKYGIEYILLDEGWSVSTENIKEPRTEVDLEELIRYGKSKNVGIVLWTLWKPMMDDLDGILDTYQKWGVKGIKVDFMQRSDQGMVNFYEAIAKAAFDRKILVDFHGSYKPSGIHRKYPNAMTFEGVYGMEHNKSSHDISPDHDLILPFTRMVAGPMDYTPGATINAVKSDFMMNWSHPMSQGTRAHQAALYVVFESPLQMLCDSPSNYYKAPEFASFIAQIPTVWDETKAIEAKAGEYVVIARRKGDVWYLAGLTNWTGRSFDVPLSFLGDKQYSVEIFADGVNANTYAQDFKMINRSGVSATQSIKINMASGGGWAAIFKLQ